MGADHRLHELLAVPLQRCRRTQRRNVLHEAEHPRDLSARILLRSTAREAQTTALAHVNVEDRVAAAPSLEQPTADR
eukprot:9150479-Pyramimonas_sp.AAC.1